MNDDVLSRLDRLFEEQKDASDIREEALGLARGVSGRGVLEAVAQAACKVSDRAELAKAERRARKEQV